MSPFTGCLAALAAAKHRSPKPRTPKSRQPGPGTPRPTRPRPSRPPPSLESLTECRRQSVAFPHITCEDDGSFTALQCSGGPRGMCFCVDTATGQRLSGMSRPHMVPAGERDMLNCTEGELQFTAL